MWHLITGGHSGKAEMNVNVSCELNNVTGSLRVDVDTRSELAQGWLVSSQTLNLEKVLKDNVHIKTHFKTNHRQIGTLLIPMEIWNCDTKQNFSSIYSEMYILARMALSRAHNSATALQFPLI